VKARRRVVKSKSILILASGIALLAAPNLASAVDQDAASWVERLEGSVVRDARARVTGVILRSSWVTDTDLDRLAELADLRVLDLSYTDITDLGLERLKPLPGIVDLNLAYAELVTDAGLANLKGWRKLERLDLRGTKFNDASVEHLNEALQSLDVSFTELTDNGLERLTFLKRLEELWIGGDKMSGVGLYSLKLLPKLKRLDLAGRQRTDSGLWSVALTDFNVESVAALRQLERLDLSGSKLTSLGLVKLRPLVELRSLGLDGTEIRSPSLAVLASLPKLERLTLWKCKQIDDDAAPYLAGSPRLAMLDLAETRLTDKGLAELQKMRRLRRLYLGGTLVTKAGVEKFLEKNPQCQISWSGAEYYESAKRAPPDEE
jgi:Leucine-rich repeat (LRR) protein